MYLEMSVLAPLFYLGACVTICLRGGLDLLCQKVSEVWLSEPCASIKDLMNCIQWSQALLFHK